MLFRSNRNLLDIGILCRFLCLFYVDHIASLLKRMSVWNDRDSVTFHLTISVSGSTLCSDFNDDPTTRYKLCSDFAITKGSMVSFGVCDH